MDSKDKVNKKKYSRRVFIGTASLAALAYAAHIRPETDIEHIIGKTIITDISKRDGSTLDSELGKLFHKYHVFGVMLYNKLENFNVENQLVNEQQVKDLVSYIKTFADYDILIASDIEGGKVNRLKHFKDIMSAEEIGKKYRFQDMDMVDISGYYHGLGKYIRSLGINMNLGPVLDVIGDYDDKYFIAKYGRSFGPIRRDVTQMGKLFVSGMRKNYVAAVLKHYPGLGKMTSDTHFSSAGAVNNKTDIEPFHNVMRKGAKCVMTCHARVSWYNNEIASQSRKAVEEIRNCKKTTTIISDEFLLSHLGMDYRKGYDKNKIKKVIENAYLSLRSGHDIILLRHTGHVDEIIGGYINRVKRGLNEGDISIDQIKKSAEYNTKLAANVNPWLPII